LYGLYFPLDEILATEEISSTALVKIDIEGAELSVLRQILANLDKYPASLQLIVEFSSGSNEHRKVFHDYIASGFSAFFIENLYDPAWYLQWRRPVPPVPLKSIPDGQSDILFVRGQAKP